MKVLIVNADDLGLTDGVNRGVLRAHSQGIVTSASMMVRQPAAEATAAAARLHPRLSLGLHVDLGEWRLADGEWTATYLRADPSSHADVQREVESQLAAFRRLVGRDPTHIDSHQHVHREEPARGVLRDLADTFGKLAAGADAFGELVRHEGDVQVSLSRDDIARLQEAQNGMLGARARLDEALTEPRSPDLVELYAATRATVRRLQHELALDERVRRQLRLLPPRQLPTRPGFRRRPAGEVSAPTGPDEDTQVLPRLTDEPSEDVP